MSAVYSLIQEVIIMKKLIAALAAALMVAFSAVPAFAVSVDSPVATTPTEPGTPKDSDSPKTGSNEMAVFATIALSLAACGAATAVLAKSRK